MTVGQALFLGYVFGIVWLLGMQAIERYLDKKGQKENEH